MQSATPAEKILFCSRQLMKMRSDPEYRNLFTGSIDFSACLLFKKEELFNYD